MNDAKIPSLLPLRLKCEQLAAAEEEGDRAYIICLLELGELVTKLCTAATVAAVVPGNARHQYRLEYEIVRCDGPGGWRHFLEDALVGPASQSLRTDFRDHLRELKQKHRLDGEGWQAQAISAIQKACRQLDTEGERQRPPSRTSLRAWFEAMVWLRNREKAHGVVTTERAASIAGDLRDSLDAMIANLLVFRVPWAYLHRNRSGKYLVRMLNGCDRSVFAPLTRSTEYAYSNGVYL